MAAGFVNVIFSYEKFRDGKETALFVFQYLFCFWLIEKNGAPFQKNHQRNHNTELSFNQTNQKERAVI